MSRTLILMQGIPGAGKSTVANGIAKAANQSPGFCVFSTDDYWYQDSKEYRFDASRLGAAHAWNQSYVSAALTLRHPVVIVDNTNIRYKDCAVYFKMAAKHGYEVQVIRVDPGLEACIARNDKRSPDRRVPVDILKRMYSQMEDLHDRHSNRAPSIPEPAVEHDFITKP